MSQDDTIKLRLGGMALANGVLVHGPNAWAAAVRLSDGSIKAGSGTVPRIRKRIDVPFLRGPVRIGESFALLPRVKREFPEARFAFEEGAAVAGIALGTIGVSVIRRAPLAPGLREATAALASLAPALLTLRSGELAGYHGAEHVSIGSYEQDQRAAKEHERCGSHLIGPLVATSALATTIVTRLPGTGRHVGRVVAPLAALGASVEIFGWMTRNPNRRLARMLARPGTLLQERLSTREPTPDQLEVAEAALAACLAAEASLAANAAPEGGIRAKHEKPVSRWPRSR